MTLLPSEESGRIFGIRSGFRNHLWVNHQLLTTTFYFVAPEELLPGQTCRAYIVCNRSDILLEELERNPSIPLFLNEYRITGRVRIISILNLVKNAELARQREDAWVRQQAAKKTAELEEQRIERLAYLQSEDAARIKRALHNKCKKAVLNKREKGHIKRAKNKPRENK